MKHIIIGPNELFFHVLRDLPYFQPLSNYYGIAVHGFDTDVEKIFLVRDVSTSPEVYQHFLITGSTTTESLADAVVKLLPYGSFYATLFPSSGSSLSDVDATQALWHGMIYSKES